MSELNGYFQIAVIFGMFITGFIGGWYVTKNAYEAGEERSFAQAVATYQKTQNKIESIDKTTTAAQSGLADNAAKLTGEVNAENTKKHTVCVHSPAMRKLLHEASLPPASLSR